MLQKIILEASLKHTVHEKIMETKVDLQVGNTNYEKYSFTKKKIRLENYQKAWKKMAHTWMKKAV